METADRPRPHLPSVPPRNHVAGLAYRAWKNLDYIAEARARGADIHLVTQTVASLVALVVFPFETELKAKLQAGPQVSTLVEDGWPEWTLLQGQSTPRLFALLGHLRHAIAHSNIRFEGQSDSVEPALVTVVFTNQRVPAHLGGGSWSAQMQADDLLTWCCLYGKWLVRELS